MTKESQKKAKKNYVKRRLKSGWRRFDRLVKSHHWDKLDACHKEAQKQDRIQDNEVNREL